MTLTMKSSKKLSNGVEIPYLGFGVFLVQDPEECEKSVLSAINNGYRSIDTATRYENEEYVGKAIKASSVPREELFITTKVWVTDFGYEETKKAFYESLKKLQLDYVDLYLIHWAAPGFEETWRAMEDLYEEGLISAIGVCNFQIHHFEQLNKTARIKPMINQVETHPLFQQVALRDYMQKHQIAHEAWGPLGQGKNGLFDSPELMEIAKKHNKTVAQIILRWHLERDTIIIPKSVHEHRIIENAELFDFELDNEDKAIITAIDTHQRSFGDPDNIERFKALQEEAKKK
ncbi:MAG TPA: aldo/keto reductase [Niallia sp.]|nr:aldo/keto reductase [Niallia sp.]